MGNKIILALVLSLVIYISQAQTNISVNSCCLRNNTATLTQAFIDLKGKKFVSSLLENNVNITILCSVDSLGTVKDFRKIRSNKELPKEFGQEVLSYLKINHISFHICYEKPSGLSTEESLVLIKRDLFTEDNLTHIINIGFPGDLMSLYVYERDKAKGEGLCLSKYDYLISMIDKYKSQSE